MFKMKTKKQVKRKKKFTIEEDIDKTMLNDASEGMHDDEEESWFTSQLLTLEDLTSEHKIMCDSDD